MLFVLDLVGFVLVVLALALVLVLAFVLALVLVRMQNQLDVKRFEFSMSRLHYEESSFLFSFFQNSKIFDE